MSRAGQAPEKNSKSEAAVPHESPQSQQIASPSTGKVMGTVFYDVDGDGRLGPGDQGVKNVGVTLYQLTDAGRQNPKPLKTDANGVYKFPGLREGDYLLEFESTATLTFPDNVRAPVSLVASDPRGNLISVHVSADDLQIINLGYTLANACLYGCVQLKARQRCGQPANYSNQPVSDVPVSLSKEGTKVAETLTGTDGCFEFDDLDCGNYSLSLPAKFGGQNLTVPPEALAVGFIGPGNTLTVGPFFYDGSPASVRGRLVLQSGAPVPGQEVILSQVNAQGQVVATKVRDTSDDLGVFKFENLSAGEQYELVAPSVLQSGIGNLTFPPITATHSQFSAAGDMVRPDIVYSSGILIDSITGQLRQLGQAASTLATVGVPITQPQSSALAMAAPGRGMAYNQVVNAGVAQVLGSSSFQTPTQVIALLNNAFVEKKEGGRTYYSWRPRGVIPSGSPLGGQVVGAQATLYQQAQDIQDAAKRLLDGVEPVIQDPDLDDIAAFQDDIRNTLDTIVWEIGRNGGAVPQRVEMLMISLQQDIKTLGDKLGINAPSQSPQQLDMDLAKREQDVQNFRALESYLGVSGMLLTIWNQYKTQVAKFAGTNLAVLNWTIDAIPDTVQAVYAAMDSVGFGASDRRLTSISPTNSISIEQLLMWIESAASADWSTRLAAGAARKSEVQAVGGEAKAQQSGVQDLINNIGGTIPVGPDRPRAVLQELNRELLQVTKLATLIAP